MLLHKECKLKQSKTSNLKVSSNQMKLLNTVKPNTTKVLAILTSKTMNSGAIMLNIQLKKLMEQVTRNSCQLISLSALLTRKVSLHFVFQTCLLPVNLLLLSTKLKTIVWIFLSVLTLFYLRKKLKKQRLLLKTTLWLLTDTTEKTAKAATKMLRLKKPFLKNSL